MCTIWRAFSVGITGLAPRPSTAQQCSLQAALPNCGQVGTFHVAVNEHETNTQSPGGQARQTLDGGCLRALSQVFKKVVLFAKANFVSGPGDMIWRQGDKALGCCEGNAGHGRHHLLQMAL